jgi:hypothetical protein
VSDEVYQAAAEEYDRAAREAELLVHHLRVPAQRFREHDVPRGCAHAFASYGYLLNTQDLLDQLAREHASKSVGPTPTS